MDAKQLDAQIADAEIRLKRLRVLYDQWFTGIERIEPQQQRDQFERLLKQLQREPTANTAVRFRLQQLQQRYTSYSTYWKRVSRQIEEGTYRRDVQKAKRQRARRREIENENHESTRDAFELDLDIEVDMDSALDDALASVMTKSAVPPAQGALQAAPPVAAVPAGAVAGESPRTVAVAAASVAQGAARAPATGASLTGGPAGTSASRASSSRRFPRPSTAGAPASGPPPKGKGAGASASSPSAPVSAGVSMRVPPPAAAPSRRPLPDSAGQPDRPDRRASRQQPGVSDQEIRAIYDRYIAARKRNSERTDNVRIETVAKSVRGMMPKLTQKHAGKQIDFEIVVRGGKVALKPVPK